MDELISVWDDGEETVLHIHNQQQAILPVQDELRNISNPVLAHSINPERKRWKWFGAIKGRP